MTRSEKRGNVERGESCLSSPLEVEVIFVNVYAGCQEEDRFARENNNGFINL